MDAGENMLVRLVLLVVFSAVIAPAAMSQITVSAPVPRELWGKWVVVKELNTRTVSCWGEKDVKRMMGTTIEYSPDSMSWRSVHMRADGAKTRKISAEQFHDENSGGGANDSQVDFGQLGIKTETVTQITIQHHDAEITRATVEFPGDEVLVKDPDLLVFALCNVYFEAKRTAARHK